MQRKSKLLSNYIGTATLGQLSIDLDKTKSEAIQILTFKSLFGAEKQTISKVYVFLRKDYF